MIEEETTARIEAAIESKVKAALARMDVEKIVLERVESKLKQQEDAILAHHRQNMTTQNSNRGSWIHTLVGADEQVQQQSHDRSSPVLKGSTPNVVASTKSDPIVSDQANPEEKRVDAVSPCLQLSVSDTCVDDLLGMLLMCTLKLNPSRV